jgi:hypothetical protein
VGDKRTGSSSCIHNNNDSSDRGYSARAINEVAYAAFVAAGVCTASPLNANNS